MIAVKKSHFIAKKENKCEFYEIFSKTSCNQEKSVIYYANQSDPKGVPGNMQNMEYSEIANNLQKRMEGFVREAEESYVVPERAFQNYRVKRGLRELDGTGVVAGVTRIGNAHGYVMNEGEKMPDEGVLTYRGYDVNDLIFNAMKEGRFGFE